MNSKFVQDNIIWFLIPVIVIVAAISVILIINNNSKEIAKESTTKTTKAITTKTETTVTATETTEETTEVIATTQEQTTVKSSTSDKPKIKETTSKTPVTTESTTEEIVTSSPKDKFPEGYTVTENPYYNDSTAGDYWVCGSVEFHWTQLQDDDMWIDEYGNEIEKPCYWSMSCVSWSGMASETQAEKLKNILYELEPSTEGQYIGETHKITIWVWLPE